MDWALVKDWASPLAVVLQVMFFGAVWAMRKEFATKTEIGSVRERANNAHHRVDLIEEKLKAMPDGDDVANLKDGLAALDANGREMKARVETAVVGVKRIEDFLMGGGHR